MGREVVVFLFSNTHCRDKIKHINRGSTQNLMGEAHLHNPAKRTSLAFQRQELSALPALTPSHTLDANRARPATRFQGRSGREGLPCGREVSKAQWEIHQGLGGKVKVV